MRGPVDGRSPENATLARVGDLRRCRAAQRSAGCPEPPPPPLLAHRAQPASRRSFDQRPKYARILREKLLGVGGERIPSPGVGPHPFPMPVAPRAAMRRTAVSVRLKASGGHILAIGAGGAFCPLSSSRSANLPCDPRVAEQNGVQLVFRPGLTNVNSWPVQHGRSVAGRDVARPVSMCARPYCCGPMTRPSRTRTRRTPATPRSLACQVAQKC
jgi:hypothetical protein